MSFIIVLIYSLFHGVMGGAQDNVHLELISWGTELNQELQLPTTSKPSFVLLLVNDVPWTSPTLPRQSGRFSVRAPRGHGLLAVIQLLNLRKRNDYACKDYIKLSDPTGLLTSTVPICGGLKKEDKTFSPDGLVGPRVFHSASGKITVYYESDGGGGEGGSDWGDSKQVVEIVFTGYTDCLQESFSQQQKCGDKCIDSKFLCNEQINCGFQEDFAIDEQNCTYTEYSRERTNDNNTPPRSSYLVSLYLGAFLLVLMLVGVAFYHRHATYMRIKNIPT